MAKLEIENDQLVLKLTLLEKLGAFRGSLKFRLESVSTARVSSQPWEELRGFRSPGTGLPGVISLATRRGKDVKDFSAIYGKGAAVVVDLKDTNFDRIVYTSKTADTDVQKLIEAISAPH